MDGSSRVLMHVIQDLPRLLVTLLNVQVDFQMVTEPWEAYYKKKVQVFDSPF